MSIPIGSDRHDPMGSTFLITGPPKYLCSSANSPLSRRSIAIDTRTHRTPPQLRVPRAAS
jgi:hypothetical protein